MKTILLICFVILTSSCVTSQYNADEEQVTFAILGYLKEYISRYYYATGEPYEWIERFGSGEKAEADRFEEQLLLYHKLKGRPYMVERVIESSEYGSYIVFYGEWMNEQINRFYHNPDPQNDGRDIYTIDRNFILKGKKESLRAYLTSVCDRHGHNENKNLLYLANASDLSETIAEVLIALGSEWVIIYTMPDNIPVPYAIRFDVPEGLNLNLLEIADDDFPSHWNNEWKRYGSNGTPKRSPPRQPSEVEIACQKLKTTSVRTNEFKPLPYDIEIDQPLPNQIKILPNHH